MRDPSVTLWPDIFAPATMNITIDRPVFKGPKPLDGREQVVFSSAGGWLVSYDGVPVYESGYRQFRAIWSSITGFARAVYIKPEYSTNTLAARYGIVPDVAAFEQVGTVKATINWGAGDLLWGQSNELFWGSEGTGVSAFDDGAFFTQSTGDCYLMAQASRGAVTITVSNSAIYPLEAGDYFEINGRVHLLQGISGNTWSIWPPLRDSYETGTVIEIDDPRMLAYVTTDSRVSSISIGTGSVSHIAVDFIEANW